MNNHHAPIEFEHKHPESAQGIYRTLFCNWHYMKFKLAGGDTGPWMKARIAARCDVRGCLEIAVWREKRNEELELISRREKRIILSL